MQIIPKGILAQYLCMRIKYTKEETIRRMTFVRPVREWLMAGNPMKIETCIDMCRKWKSNGCALDYNYDDESQSLQIMMNLVNFQYSMKDKQAVLVLDSEACGKLGWTQTEYHLKRQHCCNMDRVFTLNERLNNAIELPLLIEKLEKNGILKRKKEEFNAIRRKLDWWSNILNMYCCSTLCFMLTRNPKHIDENEDIVRIGCYIEGIYHEKLTMLSSDTSFIDKFLAAEFLPWLTTKKKVMEDNLEYLQNKDIVIPDYTINTQPVEFDKYFEKKEIVEQYRPIYNLLYETAINLGMNDKYDGHYFYFYFNTEKKPYTLHIILHSRPIHNLRLNFTFGESDWQKQFPLFWKNVKERAIRLTEQSIEAYENSIRSIKIAINCSIDKI